MIWKSCQPQHYPNNFLCYSYFWWHLKIQLYWQISCLYIEPLCQNEISILFYTFVSSVLIPLLKLQPIIFRSYKSMMVVKYKKSSYLSDLLLSCELLSKLLDSWWIATCSVAIIRTGALWIAFKIIRFVMNRNRKCF